MLDIDRMQGQKVAGNLFGIVSVLISAVYWGCILLPKSYWPYVCPLLGHSMGTFVVWMLVSVGFGVIAVAVVSRWWIAAPALAMLSLFMGGTTI